MFAQLILSDIDGSVKEKKKPETDRPMTNGFIFFKHRVSWIELAVAAIADVLFFLSHSLSLSLFRSQSIHFVVLAVFQLGVAGLYRFCHHFHEWDPCRKFDTQFEKLYTAIFVAGGLGHLLALQGWILMRRLSCADPYLNADQSWYSRTGCLEVAASMQNMFSMFLPGT